MARLDRVDYSRLLGFSVVNENMGRVDFQAETFDAKLGAKVGAEPIGPQETKISKADKGTQIELSRLLGFASLTVQKCVDFRNEIFDGRLGAKVGTDSWVACELPAAKTNKLDLNKLLGFERVGEQLSGSVDFQDETMNAKLGAKVGVETMA